MRTNKDGRILFHGEFDEQAYWERVKRNLAWLGNTPEEARRNQLKLRDATIGIAGTGGIGSAAAIRLVRMGAGHLKIADPEVFDLSNVQRQAAAQLSTLGRNKAEVTGELAFEISRDATIEVFPEGVNPESAADFVEGCDVVCDQIEVFQWDGKYALHRAMRESDKCKTLLSVATIGHGPLIHKYTRDSTPINELFEIEEGTELTPATATVLSGGLPRGMMPSFPDLEVVLKHTIETQEAPIWGPTPAICEGILIELICQEIMYLPGMVELPVRPGYAWFDAFSWKTEIVDEETGAAELRQQLDVAKALAAQPG